MNSKFLILLGFLSAPFFAETYTSAWRMGARPSLILTDTHAVVPTNGALAAEGEGAFIYIEETRISNLYTPREIFASFTKQAYPSHIILRVMDAFTEEEIFRVQMDESGSAPWQGKWASDRVYFIVELYGRDLQLRSVGLISEKTALVKSEQFYLDKSQIRVGEDVLSITAALEKEAELTLLIFDSQGNVVGQPVLSGALPAGEYQYNWDPSSQAQKIAGEDYYVWLKASHPHAAPIEMIRSFRLIP